MTVQQLPEDDATTYEELVCPDCLTRCVVEETRLSHQYDEPHKKLIYAARCDNESCQTERIDPSVIKSQVKTTATREDYISAISAVLTGFKEQSGKILGLVLLLAIFGGGIAAIDSVGSIQQQPETQYKSVGTPLSPNPTEATRVNVTERWGVFESEGQYAVVATVDGSRRYLTPNGTQSRQPYLYPSSEQSKRAILTWYARASERGNVTRPTNTGPANPTVNWTVYQNNDWYIVSSVEGETVQYLNKRGQVVDHPVRFESGERVTGAVLGWAGATTAEEAQSLRKPSQKRIQTELATATYDRRCTVWNYTSWRLDATPESYRLIGQKGEKPVYLQSNGTVTTSPASVQNYTGVVDAVRTWKEKNQSTRGSISPLPENRSLPHNQTKVQKVPSCYSA